MVKKGGYLNNNSFPVKENTSITNEISKGVREFQAPNIVTWFVLPASMVFVLILLITFSLNIKFTGKSKQKICSGKGSEKKCEDKEISNKYKIWILILILIMIPFSVGYAFYKLGIMILNPRVGAGILAAGMIGDSLNGD